RRRVADLPPHHAALHASRADRRRALGDDPVARRLRHHLLHLGSRNPDLSGQGLFHGALRRDARGQRRLDRPDRDHHRADRDRGAPATADAAGRRRRMTAPAIVRIEGVTKRFGGVVAVDDVSLEIRPNEFFALLGPSGCGKTTLLRILAGLERASAGRILIDGEDMAGVPPNRRPVNMVFQSYAVFPHMSVADNVAYGLRVTGATRAEIGPRVKEALAMVRLHGLEARRPDQLAGGQRQRAALARALIKRPKVLLLDEPLSALDRKLRQEMQLELVRLQQDVGITFVIVTHDQDEALSMADRIAVMDQGRILQVAPPQELYEAPNSRMVADFIGTMNLFPARVLGPANSGLRLEAAGLGAFELPDAPPASGEVGIAVRPEK